jgi:hypothetical protein
MGVFEITDAQGRVFEIEAPDQNAAMTAWQRYSSQQQAAPSTSYVDEGGQAVPPAELRPGTREYADWAAANARAGNALPQVSDMSKAGNQSSVLDPLVQGITFGWGDELRGAVQGGMAAAQGGDFGSAYEQVLDESRGALERERRVNPLGSMAAEVAGAIPTGMIAGGQLAGRGASLLGRIGTGALVGAGQGAAYGAGASDDNRAMGAAFGGATGGVVGGAIPAIADAGRAIFSRIGAAMPEIDDLYRAKNAAYAAVDNSGFSYKPNQIDDLITDIYKRVGQEGIDTAPDGAHKAAIRMLERLNSRQGPMTLGQLDQLRQVIRRDVIDSGSRADGYFGGLMIDAIDDFIDKAGGAQVIGAARQAHQTLRKSELLAEALEKAQRQAASSGSGGNIDNAIRQQIKSILNNPSRVRSFTKAERAAMDRIVSGGSSLQGFLRLVGKLSPSGNGLMAALGVGATAANPLMAIPIGAGLGAKAIADRATIGGARALEQAVRTGLPPLPAALPPPGMIQQGIATLPPMLGGRVGEYAGR